ncbi:MAG: hypothetical protein BWY83_03190 [bacterium ADurb.Bin478]|nr:MAG: hypothetical protein BWY83_03190 [bacterium ADurb.Bin478]
MSGRQDVLDRTVILFQPVLGAAGIILFKIEDIADLRSAPAVDGLIVVPDYAEVAVLGRQQLQGSILGVIGILILIHHQVAKPVLIILFHQRKQLEQLDGLDQQIVEIHGIQFRQAAIIGSVNFRDERILFVIHGLVHFVGTNEIVFRHADLVADLARRQLLHRQIHIQQNAFEQGLLILFVIDGKSRGVADAFRLSTEEPCKQRMKRADPHAGDQMRRQPAHTLAHLAGCFVGKGHGQDFPRFGKAVGEDIGDAVGQHTGFA